MASPGSRPRGSSFSGANAGGLCRAHLHALPGRSHAEQIVFFSAVAHHRERRSPGTVARQRAYFAALEASGVRLRLGQFKAKTVVCTQCGRSFTGWEEKETGVAIGSRLLEAVCCDLCDTVVLVTGDTDLVPAVSAARRLDASKTLVVLQPYRRANRELARAVDLALTIKAGSYARHQLPAWTDARQAFSERSDRWPQPPRSTSTLRSDRHS